MSGRANSWIKRNAEKQSGDPKNIEGLEIVYSFTQIRRTTIVSVTKLKARDEKSRGRSKNLGGQLLLDLKQLSTHPLGLTVQAVSSGKYELRQGWPKK